MENNIFEPNNSFDFLKLSLAQPTGIQGGAYFTKFIYNSQPLYIETPKCLTKQGFIKQGKKVYTELMFDNNDTQFIHWIETLESTCHKLIFENSDSWFADKLDLNDIESAFTSSLRIYKSGKFYLLRVYGKINTLTNVPSIKIYNENENLLNIDDIKLDTNIISIIELQGIKFTNRSFQIEYEIKQIMVLTIDRIFENCLIKKNKTGSNKINNSIPNEDVINNDIILNDTVINDTVINDVVNEDIVNDDIVNEDIVNDHVNDTNVEKYNFNDLAYGVPIKLVNNLNNKVESNSIISIPLENMLEEELLEMDCNSLEIMTLKKPNEVYYKIYKEAKEKAKNAKKEAVLAMLEVKNIKNTYLINEDSDEDSDEDSEIDLNDL
jgi:hypothetical protein